MYFILKSLVSASWKISEREGYTSTLGTHGAGQARSQDCAYKVDTKGLSVKRGPGIAPLEPGVLVGIHNGAGIWARTTGQNSSSRTDQLKVPTCEAVAGELRPEVELRGGGYRF